MSYTCLVFQQRQWCNDEYFQFLNIPISKLINQSFVSGIFPEPLKLASVIPIFKKADPLECTNYRPISLTSNISKTLLVHKCLFCFLDQNEILYYNQYGFRNNHSATHALTDITEKIRNALDSKYYACKVWRKHYSESYNSARKIKIFWCERNNK